MADKNHILESAFQVIEAEAHAIQNLKNYLSPQFSHIVQLIAQSQGRIVVSGIGKSAIIAQKIVATFNSTGTPAIFMHAADAIHGDVGMVQPNDVVIIISKSGNSPEIKVLAPIVKSFGNTLIGMVGNHQSFLANAADYIVDTFVETEACPNNLAPTNSSTAQLVMGDVLAICLMKLKNFQSQDFAKFHPGGNLGKKLYLTAGALAEDNAKPQVLENTPIAEVIVAVSKGRLGATAVIDEKGFIKGIITDGDIRRMLEQPTAIQNLTASDIMTSKPYYIDATTMAVDALQILKEHSINQLLVVHTLESPTYFGMIHLQDLVKEGII